MLLWTSVLLIGCSASLATGMEGIVTSVAGGGMPHIGHVDTCTDGPTSVDGSLQTSRFNYPWGITFDRSKNSLFVADCGCPDVVGSNDRIRRIDLQADVVTSIAGSRRGYKDGPGRTAQFFHTAGMSLDEETQLLYIADSGNDVIRLMDLSTNQVSTFSGVVGVKGHVIGNIRQAKFSNPQHVVLHATKESKRLFVADTDNHAVKMIILSGVTSQVSTITGGPKQIGLVDGDFAVAKWRHPTGLAYDQVGDVMYVSDHYNHAIRLIDFKKGKVKTLAGNGNPGSIEERKVKRSPLGAVLHYPEGLALDRENDVLYIVEFGNNCVTMMSLSGGFLKVLAGGTSYGSRDAIGTDAQFYHPTGVAFDDVTKILYVTDQYNHRVRALSGVGSSQSGNGNLMKLRHLVKVDAYRDLVVHSRPGLLWFCYVIVVTLFCAVTYCTRQRWIAFLKVKYAIYNKRPENVF